jgi:DNA-binding LacI/PurR family transcriptional regulator
MRLNGILCYTVKSRQKKYVSLALRLENYVGSMPHGAKLPTMRTIAARYGASMVTLGSALHHLERKGLVKRRHGSGVFVSRKDGVKRLALLRNDWASSVSDARVQAMHEICHEEKWSLTVVQTSTFYPDDFADLEGDYDGIVLVGDAVPGDSMFFQSLLKRNVPLAILGGTSEHLRVDSVDNNDYHGMSLVFNHLYQIGHRRIALLLSEYANDSTYRRRKAFEEFSRLFNIQPTIIECGVQPADDPCSRVTEALKPYLGSYSSRRPFTAIIGISDIGAIATLRSLHDHGIPPQQCHVTGFDNIQMSSLFIPSVTTLAWDAREMAHCCLSLIRERLKGDTSPNLRAEVPASLIIRESTSGTKLSE